MLKVVSLSFSSLMRKVVRTSSITLSLGPLRRIQTTCIGDLFWDYKDSLAISLPGLRFPAGLWPTRMVWELLLGNDQAAEGSLESFKGF